MLVSRTLELLQKPNLIQKDDIGLLNQEISKYPYIQSLRALLLYATHEHQQEDYKSLLTSTAAYTTDKKILYQFVNQIQIVDPGLAAEPLQEDDLPQEPVSQAESDFKEAADAESFTKTEIVDLEHPQAEEQVKDEETISFQEVEELNPTEDVQAETQVESEFKEAADAESFTKTEIVDLEHPQAEEQVRDEETISFQEAEELNPTEETPTEKQVESEFKEAADAESFSKVEVVNPIQDAKEIEKEQNVSFENKDTEPAQVSFHKTEDFMAHVPAASTDAYSQPVVAKAASSGDNAMKRLIAEVEAKMKAKKKDQAAVPVEVEDVSIPSSEVNFSEIQHDEKPVLEEVKPSEPIQNKIEEKEEVQTEDTTVETQSNAAWKPLVLDYNAPDALLSKPKGEVSTPKSVEKKVVEPISTEEIDKVDVQIETKSETERPVLNVSFFSDSVAPIAPKKEPKENKKEEENSTSNIPTFINTWQSWLKLDKSDSVIHGEVSMDEEAKVEQKNKAIETFIEANPKISKLKEESDFVVKDRSENILHLMTETLANLYVDQKLYTKALNAFEVLIEKHPEKKEHFEERIQQIKDQKAGK